MSAFAALLFCFIVPSTIAYAYLKYLDWKVLDDLRKLDEEERKNEKP